MTGVSSSRLLPLGVDANQTAEGAGKTDEAVVKVGEAQGRGGHGEVGEVGEQLELADVSLPARRVSLELGLGYSVSIAG